MYTVGSIADIISGNKSLNKKAVQVKEIKYEYEKPVVRVNAKKIKLNFGKRVEMKNGKKIVRKPQQKPEPSGNKIMKNKNIKKVRKMLGPLRLPEKIPEPSGNEIMKNKNIKNARKMLGPLRIPANIPEPSVNKTLNKKKINIANKRVTLKPQQKQEPSGNKIMKNKNIKNTRKMLGPLRIPANIPEPSVNEILNNKKINNANKRVTLKPQQKPEPSGNKIMKNKNIKNVRKMLGPLRLPVNIPEPSVNEILNINIANKQVTLKRKNLDTPHITSKKPKLDDEKDRTIFVGNVPLDTKQTEIKKLLSSYGPVQSVRFRSVPIADLRIPRKVAIHQGKFHPKRKSMNAYVVFESKEDAIKAINANGTEFKNFHLRVDSLKEYIHNNKTAIFIANVPYDAEEEDVRKVFQDCGAIDSIRLIRDSETNIGKGIGFVNFVSPDAVHLALQLEDVIIGNRKIRMELSHIKPLEDTNKNKTPEGKKIRERFAIHINNLPENVTYKDIKEIFKPCGVIKSVRIIEGQESRFCYVNFLNASSVQHALKLGPPVTQFEIKECKPEEETKKIYPSIYITNIPLNTKDVQLFKLFRNCGKIVSAKVYTYTHRETTIGFVAFEENEGLKNALAKTFNIGNNKLQISKKTEESRIKKQEVIDSDSDSDDHNDDENIRNVSLADSDEPSEDEDNAEDLDDEEVDDEDDEDYEDAEETEELDEEEEDSNDEVDNESDDE